MTGLNYKQWGKEQKRKIENSTQYEEMNTAQTDNVAKTFENSYTVKVACTNCGHPSTLMISRGKQFNPGLEECYNCGCKTLFKMPL